ncbi:unnamed protein product, partial [Tetraodon nigroviridis]
IAVEALEIRSKYPGMGSRATGAASPARLAIPAGGSGHKNAEPEGGDDSPGRSAGRSAVQTVWIIRRAGLRQAGLRWARPSHATTAATAPLRIPVRYSPYITRVLFALSGGHAGNCRARPRCSSGD